VAPSGLLPGPVPWGEISSGLSTYDFARTCGRIVADMRKETASHSRESSNADNPQHGGG
jgi:hypothetical protein